MILFKKAGEKQKEMLWERTIHVETQATKELVLLLTETGILFIFIFHTIFKGPTSFTVITKHWL